MITKYVTLTIINNTVLLNVKFYQGSKSALPRSVLGEIMEKNPRRMHCERGIELRSREEKKLSTV